MKRMLMALGLGLGLTVSQSSYSDDEFTLQVRLNNTYELKAEYPVLVDKDRFVFSRYDKTGNAKEVVAVDPLLGTEKVLVDGNRDIRFLTDNVSYVTFYARGVGVPGRVNLLRKSDGRVFQSGRLSQGAEAAYFADTQLFLLQGRSRTAPYSQPASHWSVFDVPTLKFLREFDAPVVKNFVRFNQKVVFLDKKHVGIYDNNFREIYSASFPHEPVDNGYCDPESLIVASGMAVFVANCGEIYSFSLADGKLESRLRLDQRFYSLASDGSYLFAVPEAPANLPGNTSGVVIKLSTWKVVGKIEAMGSASYANGSNLAVMSFPKWNHGLVSVYAYAP